ncbi:poly(U)-specific 3'-to-5' RNA exonuclease [Pestalotiopsis sp. 9143b]|nr:poly(U)-specific 3'-to-5' RNA exonuclease [Pestalotiopsis sp. 9143b]
MALVDYDSDSGSDSDRGREDGEGRDPDGDLPAPKRQKKKSTDDNELPPLPSAFHDLYASTVRLSNTDDPSLHQGRRRQVPHIAGNWPSHLYAEWHPSGPEHDRLGALLAALSARLLATGSKTETKIHGFLTSDLGAPLPLHISLSRPLSLPTARKDDFLERVRDAVAKSGVGAFELVPDGLEWHRTHESARSFLVLRVRSCSSGKVTSSASGSSSTNGKREEKQEKNAELGTLLRHCNALCRTFGQPELYAFKPSEDEGATRDVGDAFHVSVAWSFSEPTEELKRVSQEVFEETEHRSGIEGMSIMVDGVKAKIGNTITHLPLAAPSGHSSQGSKRRRGLFDAV